MKPAALSILLLSAAALLEFPQIKCEDPIEMNMAVDALDVQYRGCKEETLKKFNREYILKELGAYPKLHEAWIEAEKIMNHSEYKELSLLQATAIRVYTMDSKHNHSATLNEAVRTGGKNYNNFPFKAWHFHLTDALQTLKAKEPKCYDVVRGVKNRTKVVGDIVRFGQFASTFLEQSEAEGFGKGTLFSIRTCLGVSIKKYSERSKQEEVLIPPFERFKVMEGNGTKIRLENITDHESYFNCPGGATVFKIQHTLTVSCVIWSLIVMQTH